jgi:hypothetical protein
MACFTAEQVANMVADNDDQYSEASDIEEDSAFPLPTLDDVTPAPSTPIASPSPSASPTPPSHSASPTPPSPRSRGKYTQGNYYKTVFNAYNNSRNQNCMHKRYQGQLLGIHCTFQD